ncbi:MAG TPA: outer membrane protein assembly factor BamA [Acetobacteraceae bacterium]|nr:outer membrane protein assembly factor BamA [Acetobacteraceae bacterium]
MLRKRLALLVSVALVPAMFSPSASYAAPKAALAAATPQGGVVAAITVVGNERIETGTIESYMLIQPGDPFDPTEIDRSLKTLYATGLFKTVSITRQGNDLVVSVQENPLVSAVYFDGNKAVTDKQMKPAISMKPDAVFTQAAAAADRSTILGLYAKAGHYDATVTPEIIQLPDNRVSVVYKCVDGPKTLISRINFIGNAHFSQASLRDAISSRQDAWFRFLSSSDEYNPERVKYDEELLRKFYFHHGYADFALKSADAELAPDRKSFFLTFVVDEGAQYHISSVKVVSSIHNLPGDELRPLVPLGKGDIFDGDAIEAGVKAISKRVENMGFAFAQVEPDVKPDPKNHTIALTFNVIEGPRVYVERVSISGNTRTEDQVIRREIPIAEGDAFNEDEMQTGQDNLKNLDYFKDPKIQPVPGSAPDKVILKTTLEEKATGQFSLGGGYSTDLGALANIGLSQDNFLGTGIDASISALLAQKGTQINLGVTNPYFLGRNLIAGFDLFRTSNTNTTNFSYNERSIGADVRLGFRYNQHVSQAFTYSLISRDVYGAVTGASLYVTSELGASTLSQLSQTLTFDYRDDRLAPTSGTLISLTTDFAGLGGSAKYLRVSANAAYYIPLERFFGDKAWVLKFSTGVGYLEPIFGYKSRLVDNFFLGGDNLRGFQTGGAGPHDTVGDSLGGRFLYTGSTELHFPLPVSPDLGVSGYTFADVGGLSGVNAISGVSIVDTTAPRVAIGVGVSVDTPFGLINLTFAEPIVKYKYDQVEQFRVSFGTRF